MSEARLILTLFLTNMCIMSRNHVQPEMYLFMWHMMGMYVEFQVNTGI